MDPIFTQQFNMPPPQAPSGGMFGGGSGKFGIAQAIAAALNGYLAGGQGPGREVGLNNMQMMAAMRQRALEHQQSLEDYNRKHADDLTDWRTQYDYEVAHPKPQQPGEFEQALIAGGTLPGTPEWTKAMQTRAQNMLDPVVMSPQGPMTRSQLLGGGGQPAPAGITFTPLNPPAAPGGPTPGGSGGFPY